MYAKQLMLTNLLKPISWTENQEEYTCGCGLNGQSFDTFTFSTHTSYDFFLVKCKYNSIKPRKYYPCFRRTIKWIEFIITYIKIILLIVITNLLHSSLTLKQNRKCIVYITILINMPFFINSFLKLPCLPVFILPIVSFYFIYNT